MLGHHQVWVLRLQTRTARTGNTLYTEFETEASSVAPDHCDIGNAVLQNNNQNQANACQTDCLQVILWLFLGQLDLVFSSPEDSLTYTENIIDVC